MTVLWKVEKLQLKIVGSQEQRGHGLLVTHVLEHDVVHLHVTIAVKREEEHQHLEHLVSLLHGDNITTANTVMNHSSERGHGLLVTHVLEHDVVHLHVTIAVKREEEHQHWEHLVSVLHEGGSYSKQAVSSLQPSIFLGSSSFYDLGNIDAVVSGDVLVADPSSDAESKPWLSNNHSQVCIAIKEAETWERRRRLRWSRSSRMAVF
ncbi:hypothetical protein EYF80_051619 [Liparis tanakae]|uniref:Uncharacterized protein n=1 Tax=Liparis tanakae TaxID=230148 RepID=A0A4Z2FBF1_9TELE|nr:hypothetical protein EYF80_051619 [Liparis tanakae]